MIRIALALLLLATGAYAETAGNACRFDAERLRCAFARSDTLETLVRRFASVETAALLRARIETFPAIATVANRVARERYRRSVEKQNGRLARYTRHADRALRRGRITQEEYEDRIALANRALANYRLGLLVYHDAYWFDEDRPVDAWREEPST